MQRKTVACTFFIEELDEEKREQVLFFLDGSLNFLVVFLVGLVSTRNMIVCMLRNPRMLRIKYVTGAHLR